MKFLKHITLCAAALVAFASCEDAEKTTALPAEELAAPVLADHAAIVVDEATLNNEVSFTWTAVDYGYQAAISYQLYAVYGDKEPYQIGESYTTSFTITKEALNNTLVGKEMGVPENSTSTLFLYLVARLSEQAPQYDLQSNTISLEVTTIKATSAPWIRRPLYVAGNYQGWDPGKAPVIWETAENSDVYEGLVYLGDAAGTPNYIADDGLCHFKFCPNPNWTGNLGGDPTAMTTEGDPAHITTPDGLYWVSVTLDAAHTTGSVSLTPVTKIGVIGTAIGGWGDADDLVMSLAGLPTDTSAADYADQYYAAMCGQTWEATTANCAGGEFKFRLDGAWAKNWGGANLDHLDFNGGNASTTLTGKVRFTINFRGDIASLTADETNPSPISATVEQVQ